MTARDYVDGIESQVASRISAAYSEAIGGMQTKLDSLLGKYADQNSQWQIDLATGKKTWGEYQEWKQDYLASIGTMKSQIKQLSADLANAAKTAETIVNEGVYAAYAESHAWSTFEAESSLSINTSYTLYNREAVYRLFKNGDIQLPQASIKYAKEYRWDMQHITSAITQGILQGESLLKIRNRLLSVANMSKSSAMRMARTCMTGAMNAGTLDGYNRVANMGVEVKKQWLATNDIRTRHSHAALDGEIKELDEEFSNGLQYPGDPSGLPAEVYNCRCTTVAYFPDIEDDISELTNEDFEGWKKAKTTSNSTNSAAREYIEGRNLIGDIETLRSLLEDGSEGLVERAVSMQGFDGLPTIISESDLGNSVLYRGVSAANADTLASYHNALLNGDWYYSNKYGTAAFGKGMYTAADAGVADAYAAGTLGIVEKMQLKSDAKVFHSGESGILNKSNFARMLEESGADASAAFQWFKENNEVSGLDEGIVRYVFENSGYATAFGDRLTGLAAALGYDAVCIDSEGYYIILNRTALEVVG